MVKSLAIESHQKYPRRHKRNKTAATPARLFFFGFWVSPAKHGEGWRRWRHPMQNTPTNGKSNAPNNG